MLQLGLQIVVVLISAVTVSAETTAVSTAFPVPSILTPHYDTTPDYEVSPPSHLSFTVAYLTDWGNLTDWSQSSTISTRRQGTATFCSIQNRGFWLFGSTSTKALATGVTTVFSSSISLAKTFAHPGWLVDIPADVWPPIPLTADEQEVTTTFHMRFSTEPHTHCVVVGSNKAIQFWDASLSVRCGQVAGTSMAVYQLNAESNVLTVTRRAALTINRNEYRYGSFATIVVAGHVYLYALDNRGSGAYQDVHVARAPSATVEDKSKWRYWDRGAGTWSPTEPLPTTRRQSAAVISLPPENFFLESASVFYSAYHNSYLLFFLMDDSVSLRVKYSPTPLGPWSTDDKIVYTFPARVASALVTPVPFQSGSQIAGQIILVSSVDWNSFETRVRKLKFL
ncbi:hypothetical protein POJ06DRAFT_229376 [Lipomyces tetrasporus]|uniref:DUF4185 domain-containing protein n=1 Tax=Lipomyces tetrasporus TaxID=54092 RepID=A0AAD7VP11_9ASCO|nr:uncharacterized protein POJ06DRAFT_229376 [Lipomyces tetrasporus]KAJ8096473.1 hypothetical protein POJ06DRAFT_229376 [Lipomyces tetrasporus]